MNIFKKIYKFFLKEFNVFPCPLCGYGDGGGENNFCEDCLKEIVPIKGERCRGCGGKLDGVLAQCSLCVDEPRRIWNNAFSLYEYENKVKEMIHKYKFQNFPELALPLGKIAARELKNANMADFTMIVPVPLHYVRYYSRSYNQSLIIANEISKHLNIPVKQILKRVKYSAKQSSKNRSARKINIKNSFAIKKKINLSNEKILLVDDVFTTGATLHNAAKVIIKNNCHNLSVFTIARTPRR